MKPILAKSSLARDFNLISIAIILLLFVASLWVIYDSHYAYTEKLTGQLEAEAVRADRALTLEMEQASYLLQSLGQQIIRANITDISGISQMIKSFSSVPSFTHSLAWIDDKQNLVANSTHGILSKPIDISDRDYVKKTLVDPWNIHIGRPIRTRLDGKIALPVALGISAAGRGYIGTILVHLDIKSLARSARQSLQHTSTAFVVVNNNFLTIAEDSHIDNFLSTVFPLDILSRIDFSKSRMGVFAFSSNLHLRSTLAYYLHSSRYPYIVLLGREVSLAESLLTDSWTKLLQLVSIAGFLLFLLWVMRRRIIQPATELIEIADDITAGKGFHPLEHEGVVEMSHLASRLQKINDYITERRLIEEERRSKIITLKQAKEAAELSNHIKMEFLMAMSSELRTPLNTIAGFSEVMMKQMYGTIDNERYLQYVSDIHHEATNLQKLISDVLALSRVEADMPELQEKAIDVGFVINKCIRLLSDKISAQQVNVEVRLADNLPRLKVDELRFKQIIINLLSNSLSHIAAGGEIVIEARTEGDQEGEDVFLLIFTDFPPRQARNGSDKTGRGTKKDRNIDRKPRKNVGALTNLTLPLTRALVAMHQGRIEISSPPARRRSTTITVTFPKDRIVY